MRPSATDADVDAAAFATLVGDQWRREVDHVNVGWREVPPALYAVARRD